MPSSCCRPRVPSPVSYTHLDVYKRQIWDNPNPDHAHLDMDPKNRPMYPAFINYLRMAKVVLEEMRKDGVFQ